MAIISAKDVLLAGEPKISGQQMSQTVFASSWAKVLRGGGIIFNVFTTGPVSIAYYDKTNKQNYIFMRKKGKFFSILVSHITKYPFFLLSNLQTIEFKSILMSVITKFHNFVWSLPNKVNYTGPELQKGQIALGTMFPDWHFLYGRLKCCNISFHLFS